jgi:deoxyhypusine synthase
MVTDDVDYRKKSDNFRAMIPEPAVGSSSQDVTENIVVRGFDFNTVVAAGDVSVNTLLSSFAFQGLQATHLSAAIQEINKMLAWRAPAAAVHSEDGKSCDASSSADQQRCKIFLGYTSNMISCGNREVIRFLVEHKLVDYLVSTAGGIEEDLMKTTDVLGAQPTTMSSFYADGATLRRRGLYRIGNMKIPGANYDRLNDWMMPILDAMLDEQEQQQTRWTPSKLIRRMGMEIKDPSSVYHWAARNGLFACQNFCFFSQIFRRQHISDISFPFTCRYSSFVVFLPHQVSPSFARR